MYLTEKLANFTFSTDYSRISDEAKAKAKTCMLDYVGCALAGSGEEIVAPVMGYLEAVGGTPQATIVGSGKRTSVTNAALVNGVIGHALDFDDTNQMFIGHGSASIVAAILAVAEHKKLSGKAIITAYMIGTEIQWKLGEALVTCGDHYAKGWHSTCTIGAFGAAGAVAHLLGLTLEQTTNAFGIAASEAAGFQEQFGTHCKPFHGGRSNEIGVRAALLAQNGFTSSRSALEGKGGYLKLVADKYDLDKVTNFAEPWGILEKSYGRGMTLKKFPVCNSGSGGVEGMQSIMQSSGIKADDIESIECGVRPGALNILIYHLPKTGLEAKFSVEYWMAITAIKGRLGLNEITDEVVNEPAVQALMKKVKVSGDPTINVLNTRVNIKVTLKDGRTFTEGYHPPIGAADNPMSQQDLIDKFRDCANWGHLSKTKTARALEILNQLETAENIDELMQCLTVDG